MSHSPIYIGNDSVIQVNSLRGRTGDPIEGALVQVLSIKDKGGNDVQGVDLPLTLSHIGDGNYEGELTKDIEVRAGRVYTMEVVATFNGRAAQWHENLVAQDRTA
jgi:hypothetical protein